MTNKRIAIVLALVIFAGTGSSTFATELIKNGGFESFDSNINDSTFLRPNDWGWSSVAYSFPAFSYWNSGNPIITPRSGNRLGVLATGGSATQEFWQTVDFTDYPSATLSFWWRFQAIDYGNGFGQDALKVYVKENATLPTPGNMVAMDPSGKPIGWDKILELDINATPIGDLDISDWIFASISGDTSGLGKTTFLFLFQNGFPGGNQFLPGPPARGQEATLFLDDISIDAKPSPEPTSLLLLSTGLGALGLAAWRRRK